VGHQDGVDYLVMEFLEGETLADRLAKGPLPPGQAVHYAVEIAGALDAAHRRGVVHRDLKPGNVMLTRAGAKLLDFGLARADPEATPGISGVSATPTHTRALTAEGTVVGTVQYMAPEQLEGKPADARSDLFAFGAVLYEMATGRAPTARHSATAGPARPGAGGEGLPGQGSGAAPAVGARPDARAEVDRGGRLAGGRRDTADRA
ncbi:MAG: hypothetical protein DMF51_10900, partial [Acidobacteria bacterium]